MNRIEKLLQKFCPDGVEFKALGELGEFFNGLSGKSKDDFTNGNARYISYMNVFSNLATKLNLNDFVKISLKEKQNTLKFGDVLFTGSSETPQECGMSSVITQEINENIYLNSFCFGFRFNDANLFLPDFSKYLFRDDRVRKQIIKCVNGVTRFNVSKKKFESLQIPIPPLEIQKEIVSILDAFTELQAELQARQKQYEHYRERLLSFDELVSRSGGELVKMISLGEVCQCFAGGTPKTDRVEFWDNGTISWMSSGEVNKGTIYETEKKITQLGFDKSSTKMIPPNAVVLALAGQGKTRGMVARTKISLCTNQSLCAIVPNETINYSFLYFYLKNQYMQLRQISAGDGTRGNLCFYFGLPRSLRSLAMTRRDLFFKTHKVCPLKWLCEKSNMSITEKNF